MNLLTTGRSILALALVLPPMAIITGCGGNAPFVGEKLDPVTSVTIRYSTPHLVFFRGVAGRDAFARDYVDLAPVEINRSGDRRYYIWLGIWTDAGEAAGRDEFSSVTVFADDTPLRLEISSWTAATIGASEPVHKKPIASAVDAFYEVTIGQLQRVAAATHLRLGTDSEEDEMFEPWDNHAPGKAALLEFLSGSTY